MIGGSHRSVRWSPAHAFARAAHGPEAAVSRPLIQEFPMTQHVIVAGGGPTGLLTALGLASAGARVSILEADRVLNTAPRALVYHWPVLPHLERLGILDACIRVGFLKQDYGWRLAHSAEQIEWSLACLSGVVERPFNLHLGQDKLSEVAAMHLAQLTNVVFHRGARVEGATQDAGGVRVSVRDEGSGAVQEIGGEWLVGADGAASIVRQAILATNFFGITWPERFIATNMRYDFERFGYARTTMQLDDELGAVIVKIDDDRLWRVTYMESAALPLETLEARVHAMYHRLLPEDSGYELLAYSPYRMHQRCADTMRAGRVLLVGDAAHVTNPTGGLGLTGGMFDAFALAEALNRVIHEGADVAILNRYSNDRRRIFLEIVSPRATQNKLNVFHSGPGRATDALVARLRETAASPEKMREALSFTTQLESRF
jgi:2-polyprenyl-6-methoxyphenol hydroxylase-like FAD-dependent oxidoreductase